MVRSLLRDNVREATAVLGTISLALVFAAAGQRIPTALLPEAPDAVLDAIPHLNAAISLLAIGTIAAGWREIRRGRIDRHKKLMGASTLLFASFLVLYLYRVAVLGRHGVPGPDAVYTFVFLPLLAIHILLAMVCVPLLWFVGLLAATRSIPEIRESPHAKIGRIAAALWLVSFSLGVIVYLLLYVVY
jgi:putative membrane protein